MASSTPFTEILQRNKQSNATSITKDVALAVAGGRQTVPQGVSSVGAFINEMALISPEFQAEILGAIEHLAKYHPDLSLAVDNIVHMGNTECTFQFDDSVSDVLANEMRLRIASRSKNWYSFSGGMKSLVNDCLAQVAICGAISAEIVVQDDLKGVAKAVLVPASTIRFVYDNQLKDYTPLQIPMGGTYTAGVDTMAGIKLNTVTYQYIASRRFGEKPYAIPPFLAALYNINIDKDILQNLQYVIKKLGILGFLEVLIKVPKQNQGEDEGIYQGRIKSYLDSVTPEIDKGINRGYVVGVEGNHSFNMHSTSSANMAGSREIIDANDVKMMAGLKQNPLLMGRNFSTTETLARVILAQMVSQVGNYQMLIGILLEKMVLLDLQLAGYPVTAVTAEFKKPTVSDELKDAQTYTEKVNTYNLLYQQGVISQNQRASALGYEKADQEEPRAVASPIPTVAKEANNPKGDTASTSNMGDRELAALSALELGADTPEFDYGCPDNCTHDHKHTHSLAVDEPQDMEEWNTAYLNATTKVYQKAIARTTKQIAKTLSELGEGATQQQIVDKIMYNLYKDWKVNFTEPQKKVVQDFVEKSYDFFRRDKKPFPIADGIPDAVFNQIDLRALDYYKASDTFYLGKFITDKDIKKSINEYVKNEYLTRNVSIRSEAGVAKFKESFPQLMEQADWKIDRIINTTVNKMRNTAAVNYFEQAGIQEFMVVGVRDRLRCAWCKDIDGKRFSVSTSTKLMSNAYAQDPTAVGYDSPFLTSSFKNVEDMKTLTGAEIQAKANFISVPTHCNCRCVVAPVM